MDQTGIGGVPVDAKGADGRRDGGGGKALGARGRVRYVGGVLFGGRRVRSREVREGRGTQGMPYRHGGEVPGKTDEMTQFLRQGGSYELTCPTTASLDGRSNLTSVIVEREPRKAKPGKGWSFSRRHATVRADVAQFRFSSLSSLKLHPIPRPGLVWMRQAHDGPVGDDSFLTYLYYQRLEKVEAFRVIEIM